MRALLITLIFISISTVAFIGGTKYHPKQSQREVVSAEIRLTIPKDKREIQKRMLMNNAEKTMLEEMMKWPEFKEAK